MDNGNGRFVMQNSSEAGSDEILENKIIQEAKDKGAFLMGEVLHIKNSNFEIVNIDPSGIMRLKLLPK